MSKLVEYYVELERGINIYEDICTDITREMNKSVHPAFEETDWYGILANLRTAIDVLNKMKNVHMFERVSKEQLDQLFSAHSIDASTGKIVFGITHNIASYETPRSIEVLYGVSWVDILEYNDITAEEFESLDTVIIPVPLERLKSATTNIMTFGDQAGLNVLGKDISETLEEDDTGDLKALAPAESFAQNINNLANSQKGSIQYYEDYGMDIDVGEDWAEEAYEGLIQIRIMSSLKKDPRVKEVQVPVLRRESNKIYAEVVIIPFVGDAITIKRNL